MDYLKLRNYNIALYIYVFSLLLFYFLYIVLYQSINDDLSLSIWYVLSSFLSIHIVWNASGKQINLLFMHLLTFQLFIGGRFYVYIFNDSWNIFETTFFYDYIVNRERAKEIVFYPISYQIFITMGYCIARIYPVKCLGELTLKDNVRIYFSKLIKIFFPFLCAAVLYLSIMNFMVTAINGYGVSLVDVSEKNISVSFIYKFAPMLLVYLAALSYVYCEKSTFYKYLILYFINGIIIILGGSRGSLGVVIMLALWFYSMNHKVSLTKFFSWTLLSVFFMISLFLLSVRYTGMDDLSPFDMLNYFVYSNGISLMVFDAARIVDNYPIIPYFQTFITGFSYLLSFFMDLNPQDVSFEFYMCNTLNPVVYSNGAGLGWTSLGDFYLFSGRTPFFFCVLALMYGHLLSSLERWGDKSLFFKYVCISLAPGLLMSPRGGLYSFFPSFLYIYLFFLILRTVSTCYLKKA